VCPESSHTTSIFNTVTPTVLPPLPVS